MKLLLQRNVDKLGRIGEVVEVARGYGRNYLLPQGLAVELTPDNINRFETMKRRLIALEQETKDKQIVLARELEKASCTIIANSSEEGHLYGSVSARDIAAQLAADGFQVEQKCILLDQPIKELGIYMVKVRLHPDVECQMKVWVVKGDDAGEARRKGRQAAAEGAVLSPAPPPEGASSAFPPSIPPGGEGLEDGSTPESDTDEIETAEIDTSGLESQGDAYDESERPEP